MEIESSAVTTRPSVCGPGRSDAGWSCVAPNAIILFLGLCFLSTLATAIAAQIFPAAGKGSVRQQRNVASYIVGLLVKTVSLVTIISSGAPLIFLNDPLSDESTRICFAGGFLLVSTFYAWEVTYRLEMDVMLLIHHVTTLALVVVVTLGSFDLEKDELAMPPTEAKKQALNTGRQLMLRITLVEILAASTNQPILVALLLHREKSSASGHAFFAAAVWEAVSKNLRFVVVIFLYCTGAYEHIIETHCNSIQWCLALRIIYPLLAIVIWVANMHMVHVLVKLARRRESIVMAKASLDSSSQPSDEAEVIVA